MGDELSRVVQEILSHVGEERLSAEYGLDSMEIPGDLLRRLARAAEKVAPDSGQA